MITQENGGKREIKFGDDLNIDSERELTKDVTKPVFVIGYPLAIKPFYVKENPHLRGSGMARYASATWLWRNNKWRSKGRQYCFNH